LAFEIKDGTDLPTGWKGTPDGTIFTDEQIVHSGNRSVRIERNADSAASISVLTKALPIDFKGKQIQLRGYLRTNNVEQFAGLLLREENGDGKVIAIDNMQRQIFTALPTRQSIRSHSP
jgi:hypothetical protein